MAFVMGGALLVALPAFQAMLRWRKLAQPACGLTFQLPTRSDVDLDLVAGSALFGAGWGMMGLCPGPALASLVTLQPQLLAFVAAMVAAMWAEASLPSLLPAKTISRA